MLGHQQIVDDYRRDGVVRIREFFPTALVNEIRDELDRYIREDLDSKPTDARTVESDGKTIRNLWRLEQHNHFFGKLGKEPELLELIGKLVNGKAMLTGVETFNKPALVGSGVPYHQDNAYFCQTPPDMLTVWVAIDPVTVENGAVYFIKGSHQQGVLPTKPSGVTGNSIGLAEEPSISKADQFCATLQPGDATIHHCDVIHHSDPNTTSNPRLGLLLVYRGTHTKTDPELHATYTEAVTATPPA